MDAGNSLFNSEELMVQDNHGQFITPPARPVTPKLPLSSVENRSQITPPQRARRFPQSAIDPIKCQHQSAKRLRIEPDFNLPRPIPSPFFTFQVPTPSVAKRKMKKPRASAPAGLNPFAPTLGMRSSILVFHDQESPGRMNPFTSDMDVDFPPIFTDNVSSSDDL